MRTESKGSDAYGPRPTRNAATVTATSIGFLHSDVLSITQHATGITSKTDVCWLVSASPDSHEPNKTVATEYGRSWNCTNANRIAVTNRPWRPNTSAVMLYVQTSGEKAHVKLTDNATANLILVVQARGSPSPPVNLKMTAATKPHERDPKTALMALATKAGVRAGANHLPSDVAV